MKKTLSLTLAILWLSGTLFAETYVLDLEKSISIAKEKSLNMLSLKQDVNIAGFNLKTATSRLKTHIDLNLVTPNYSNNMKRFEDSTGIYYRQVKTMGYQGSLIFNQPLPTDGSISIESGLTNDEDFLYKKRTFNLGTNLRFSQPLNSLYGYNNIQATLKRANLDYEMSNKRFKREELNLVYNVTNSFFSLLNNQKREEIAKLNLERQKEAYTIAKNKFDAGLIKEVEALQMEVDLSEAQNNFDMSIVNQSSALNALKSLIGLDLKDSIVLSSTLDYKVVVVNPEKALQLAMDNRLEIREQEIQIEQSKLNIRSQKAEGMIKGNLVASYGLSGNSQQERNTPFSKSVNSAYQNILDHGQTYGVGLNVSIPILDWGENRSRVNAAKAQLKKNIYSQEETRRNIEQEIGDLVANLNSSLKRLQLLEKSVKVAEKSFEITRQRFSDGDIDSQAMALERERLNNASTSHLSAFLSYQLLLADLMRKTFYDFQRDAPIQ